jgi:hypothetical protein
LDTHFVTVAGQSIAIAAPFTEDNDESLTQPDQHPANDLLGKYGIGTTLHGADGIINNYLATQALAYIVMPTSAAARAIFGVAEQPVNGTFNTSASYDLLLTTSEHPLSSIVSLAPVSNGAPSGFGNRLSNSAAPGVDQGTFDNGGSADNILHIIGAPGGYTPGHVNNIGGNSIGQGTFYVEATGWNPLSDQETFALNIKVNGGDPTPAQIQDIAADISISNSFVSAVPVTGQYATEFPGYDILLTFSGMATPDYLGINFANDTVDRGVTVTDVAAVPEPNGAAAAVLLATAGLLLGRRRTVARAARS